MKGSAGLLAAGMLGAWCAAATAQPLGGPFQVNTFTTGIQDAPAVAVAPNGSFVVVWESSGQDGYDFGVFGQRHSSTGAKQGTEFQVNTFTFGPQGLPAVSSGADGSFVVVWQGYGSNSDQGDDSDIFARRYGSSGAPLTSAFGVTPPLAGFEGAAAVATIGTGFVVVWDDYYDVFARRYDSAGTPLTSPLPVNAQGLGFQGTAGVTATLDGGFVIAWETDVSGGEGTDYDVFARRFNALGAPAGTEFQVNTTTTGYQYAPSVAATANGGFVVVWASYAYVGAYRGVFARRFDGGSAPLGTEFPIESATGTDANEPQVVADEAGSFVVVWTSATPSDAPTTVLSQRFDDSGAPFGSVVMVDSTGASAFQPGVGVAPDGRHVVAWRRDGGDSNDAAVFAQRYAVIVVSPTPSPTITVPTPTRTVTQTIAPTATATSSASATVTVTRTPTRTSTRTRTGTVTRTATRTATGTGTFAPSPTETSSATRTATLQSTPTATPTHSVPPAATHSQTAPPSPTRSATPSVTATGSGTRTASASRTATGTATRTSSLAPTPTGTATPTATVPSTATHTPVNSATLTSTASATPTTTATATPTDTAAPATQTSTATAATPIPTATETATGTATTIVCAGDCNRNGAVTVNELVTAVNIALDDAMPMLCTPADGNADGAITIDELIRAVNRLLQGC